MSGPWWHDAVVYQVYVRSFADSNGDGVGDLDGIRSRLPYLADLGADAIWVTPFYPSPMHDHGYDVADHCDVDPRFGDLAAFDRLLAAAHAAGIRVIVDLVPNHTSIEHPWFRDHRDWYVWRPPAPDGGPPNNWQSVFSGPAWTYDRTSGEYYLHLFDSSQPDLDWRNPAVHDAWDGILRFWLDRGVDGFRVDVAHGLYKHAALPDNPESATTTQGAEHYNALETKHNWDQPETLDVYRRWRRICDSYEGGSKMMVGEVFLLDLDRVAAYVGPDLLHQAFNFTVMGTAFAAPDLAWVLRASLERIGAERGSGPTWVLSNHDLVRHVTRYGGGALGDRRGRAVTAVLMALPGTPYVYQGEELGLEQSDVPPERRQDPIWHRSGGTIEGRDGCRTPLPWVADEPGHGFTTGEPWLPFGADATAKAVDAEAADPGSTLAFYRRVVALRRALRGTLGDEVEWLATPPETLGFRRSGLTCLLNAGARDRRVRLPEGTYELLLDTGGGATVEGPSCTVPATAAVWLGG